MKKGPAVLLVLGLFTLIVAASWQPSPKRAPEGGPSNLSLAVTGQVDPGPESYAQLYHSVNAFMAYYLEENQVAGEWGLTESRTGQKISMALPPNANFLLWADLNFESRTDTLKFCRAVQSLPGIEIRSEGGSCTENEGSLFVDLQNSLPGTELQLQNGRYFLQIQEIWKS